mmetsp:Transcript_2076/g.2685  ORF Transcript_2076/g.2685 Transcript_2076/m.2685 type:complete len:329 (+) Transcript_2076:3-989(+)
MCYLRTVHRFCGFLRRGFNHTAELEAASPAAAIQNLLNEALSSQEDRAAGRDLGSCSIAQLAPQVPEDLSIGSAEDQEDPLDAFMKQLEADPEALLNVSVEGQNSKRAAPDCMEEKKLNDRSAKRQKLPTSEDSNQAASGTPATPARSLTKDAAQPTATATLPSGPAATEEILNAAAVSAGSHDIAAPRSRGAAAVAAPGRRGLCTPQASSSGSSKIRLATGDVIELPMQRLAPGSIAAATGHKAADKTSALSPLAGGGGGGVAIVAAAVSAGTGENASGVAVQSGDSENAKYASKERSLQNMLLGELDSEDESELEDEQHDPAAVSA